MEKKSLLTKLNIYFSVSDPDLCPVVCMAMCLCMAFLACVLSVPETYVGNVLCDIRRY